MNKKYFCYNCGNIGNKKICSFCDTDIYTETLKEHNKYKKEVGFSKNKQIAFIQDKRIRGILNIKRNK